MSARIYTKTIFFPIAGLCLLAMNIVGAQSQGEREYVGAMGSSLRIRMKLNIQGKTVSGSYIYEAVGRPLQLDGTLSGRQITLKETDDKGKHTGTFKGQFVTATLIEGTWTNPAGSKSLPFSVKAIADSSTAASPSSSSSSSSGGESSDGVSGQYRRVDANGRFEKESGATLNIRLRGAMAEIQGDASLVVNAKTGNVRTGNVEGSYKLTGNIIKVKGEDEYSCSLTITFGKGTLEVTGDNGQCGGLAVSFDGSYRRVGPPKFE